MMASAEGGEGAGRPNLPPSNWAGVLLPAALAGAASGPPPALWLREGRIVAVGAAALAAGPEVPRRALPGLTLAPAPLDGHVRLALGAGWAANLAACRRAGLAAVRDLGFPARKSPREPLPSPPPLVILAGRGLGPAGEARSWLAEALTGPAAFAAATRRRVAAGRGVVKLFASGLLDFACPGRVEHPEALGTEEMAAAVAEAHRADCRVAAHASGPAAARALAAGVDSLEHGFFMGEAELALMAARGTAWLPTLAAVLAHAEDPEGRHAPPVRANLAAIARGQAALLRRARELGVNLVLGSDAGSYGLPPGPATFAEMRAWLAAGLPGEEVFAAATWRAARLLGLAGELGSLAAGARAWLLAVAGDPVRQPLLLAEPVWRSYAV